MKINQKRRLLNLTVMLLCVAFFIIFCFGNVTIIKASENVSDNCVYYISDSTPLIDNEMFDVYYPGQRVVYEWIYDLNDAKFIELLTAEFYLNISENDVVIFEFKLVRISDSYLRTVFNDLTQRGISIIFISCYDNYALDLMTEPVNFIHCEEDIYARFFNDAVEHMVDNGFGEQPEGDMEKGYMLLLDDIIVNFPSPESVEPEGLYDIIDICEVSPYFCYILNAFNEHLNLMQPFGEYDSIARELIYQGIDIIAYHYDENESGYRFTLTCNINSSILFELPNDMEIDDLEFYLSQNYFQIDETLSNGLILEKPIRSIFVYPTSNHVYNFLSQIQNSSMSNLYCYVFEKEPLPLGSGGLMVLSDISLREYYEEDPNVSSIYDDHIDLLDLLGVLI